MNCSETKENLKKSLNDLTNCVFPKRATKTWKRFMQRFLKKPSDMKTRDFISCVIKLNGIFGKLPQTNNYLVVIELYEDELLDLIEYGLLLHWKLEMVLHNFDRADHTLQ